MFSPKFFTGTTDPSAKEFAASLFKAIECYGDEDFVDSFCHEIEAQYRAYCLDDEYRAYLEENGYV